MARKTEYNARRVIEAIQEANGVVTHAAEILGCNPCTIYRKAREYSTVQDAIDNSREDLYAEAQTHLVDMMRDGDHKDQKWAIDRILKVFGPHVDDGLDWTEKQDLNVQGGVKVRGLDFSLHDDEE